MVKKKQSIESPAFPQLSAGPKVTDATQLQDAARVIHGCINELLKAGRILNMETANAVITNWQLINKRLIEADEMANQIKKLIAETQRLAAQLEAAKKSNP